MMAHRGRKYPSLPVSARGLTLIELMVAVALLSIMILCFGKIISEARKTVAFSEATARANNTAWAVDMQLREDVSRASQFGFLFIGKSKLQLNSGEYPDILICASVGPSFSVIDTDTALAKVSAYSLCPSSTNAVLWKAGWILSGPANSVPGNGTDNWGKINQGEIQTWPETGTPSVTDDVITKILDTYRPGNLPEYCDNMSQINQSWKYLASNCSSMEISWTDGSADSGAAGGMKWNAATSAGTLWTKDGTINKWPKAIKIRFTIQDRRMPDEFRVGPGLKYEVICPVAR